MADECSFSAFSGAPLSASDTRPDPWPMISCRFVVSSAANAPHRSARADFVRAPRELAAELARRRLLVGLGDVRERHRLAAVGLANVLVVGQVDADRRDGPGIARLDDDLDRPRRDAGDLRLAPARIPGHPILEPLRVSRDGLHGRGLLGMDVVDERLPRALHAARVHVDLDEPVDRVHVRVGVGHPGDVVARAGRSVSPVV